MKSVEFLRICCMFLEVTAITITTNRCAQLPDDTVYGGFQSDNRDFALVLYNLALEKSENKNLVFSPASISMVVGMLHQGSRLTTRSEIRDNFLNTVADENVAPSYARLMNELDSDGKQYELDNANAMFVERTFGVRPIFKQTITNCFESIAEKKNFAEFPDESREEVNEWVEDATESKITDLIPAGAVDSLTKMILTNAIYFKGDWEIPFDTENGALTAPGNFYPVENNYDTVQTLSFMNQRKQAYFYETVRMRVLGLPYEDQELTMFMFVPKDGYTLSQFESEVSAKQLEDLMNAAEYGGLKNVQVSIPKFKMAHEVPLQEVLEEAGIRTMFTADADFWEISFQQLYVSGTFHKAIIEVNEEGTEAAAATAAVITVRGGFRFSANRPFLYILRHKLSGSTLFMGRLSTAEGLE